MLTRIAHELKHHAPFTLGGTVMGVGIMLAMHYGKVSAGLSEGLFSIFHPLHVLLSAMATAGMYRMYGRGGWVTTLLIGVVGAIGVATVSDSLIPYVGERLLSLPEAHIHAGFIEQWYLVFPLAVIGVAIAWFRPKATVPHVGHVLLSTWASLFHITMAMGGEMNMGMLVVLPAFLFLAVWLPCCTSDIIFPLLFVSAEDRPPCSHCHDDNESETPEDEQ